jgi:hypothetical protein
MQVPCPNCQAPIPVPIFALGPLEAPVPVLCPRCRAAVELRQGTGGVVTASPAPQQRRGNNAAADSFFHGQSAALADTDRHRRVVPQRSRDAEMLREFSVMFRQSASRSWGASIGLVLFGLAAAGGVGFGVWFYLGKQTAQTETDDALAAATAFMPDATSGAGSPAMPKGSQLAEHLQGLARDARTGKLRPNEPPRENPPVPTPVNVAREATPTGSSVEPVNRKDLDALCHTRSLDMQACSVRFARGAPIQVYFTVSTLGQIGSVRAEVDGARQNDLTICVAETLRTSRFGYQPEDVHHVCAVRGLVQAPEKKLEHKHKRSQ